MTSPINFGGGVGTQPVIQNPGIGEQLAPLLEALQSGQQQQAQAELLALQTQKAELDIANAQARFDQDQLDQQNQEELGTLLTQLAAPPEIEQVDTGAGVGTASVPVQSPDLNELIQTASPAIVEEALKRGAPIQEARDRRAAERQAFKVLREKRRDALAALDPGVADLLQKDFNMQDAGADTATRTLILKAELAVGDKGRIKNLRANPLVRSLGFAALPDAEMVTRWGQYLTGITNAAMARRVDRNGKVVSAAEESRDWISDYVKRRKAPGLFGQVFKGTDAELDREARNSFKLMKRSQKAQERELAQDGANRPLVTPDNAILVGGVVDEKIARLVATKIPEAINAGSGGTFDIFSAPGIIDPAEAMRGDLEMFLAQSNVDFDPFRVEAILQRAAWLALNPGK